MDAIERDEHLRKLKHLVEHRTSMTADELGRTMLLSRRTVFRLLNHLKIREQKDIRFCRTNKCYYFREED
ncbi:MAG TPA: hypothetical protein VNZ86_11780 [Bacteroidia bacterium]|nr:hypothetical protein [Bacteroidia bacterium]